MDSRLEWHREFGVALTNAWCEALVRNDIEQNQHLSASEETLTAEMREADRVFNRACDAAEWPVPFRPSNWVEGLVTMRYEN